MDYLDPTFIVMVLCIAWSVGFLTGVFGIGGRFLLSPALIVLLHVEAHIAIGTDLAMMLCTSSFGLWTRRRTETIDWKLAIVIGSGSVVGVLIGVRLLERLKVMPPLMILDHQVDAARYVLLWAFLLLLTGISVFMIVEYFRSGGDTVSKRVGLFARLNVPPLLHFHTLEEPKLSVYPVVLLGLTAGLCTGLLGIGGGVLLLPSLMYLVGQRAPKAAHTSLALACLASLVGVTRHLEHGNIGPVLLLELLAGGLFGTYCGVRVGLDLPGPKIRFYFVFVVLAAVVLIGYKLCRETFGLSSA